jgi:hypothetical protein
MLNMTAHFEKLYVFTDILNSGQYDPVQHLMPPGYVKYCVLVQHDLEECVPFPPSVNPTTTTVDDCEVCTIAATTHATSVEAIGAQDELVDDLYRGHADQHHHRGPNGWHSHGVGEGQRAMWALINVFEVNTELSKLKGVLNFLQPHASNWPTECECLCKSDAQKRWDSFNSM